MRLLAASSVVAASFFAASTLAADIVSAEYTDPTTRYTHGILGDAIEYETLSVTLSNGQVVSLSWRDTIVFEDVAPRLVDLNGGGNPEIIVVETHENLGARLSVYGEIDGKISLRAANDFIGRTNRWLSPIGAADFDGDGTVEIGYIDRPHLAKTLRLFRYSEDGDTARLTLIGEQAGLTNHRIGERDIGGGVRDCGQGPEMITASADWSSVVVTQFKNGTFKSRVIGADTSRAGLNAALRCAY